MKTTEQAKRLLDLGWSIIPLRAGEKTPSIPWNEYRTRQMTHQEVDTHFKADSNIGLVCGKLSGVMVIDQDFYKGDVDLETFKGIDSPLKSITGRGGVHLFFQYKEGSQNTVNEKVKADIRSEGGYVVIAPSMVNLERGRTGKYAWVTEPTAELLQALPEAPESLLSALYASTPHSAASEALHGPKIEYASLCGLPEGGRNNAISKTSLSLLARGLPEEVTWTTIQSINNSFTPPLPLPELQKTFQSAVRRNADYPSTSTFGETKVRQIGDTPVPTEAQVSIANRTTDEDLDLVLQQMMSGKVQGMKTGYEFLDATMGGFIPSQSYLLFADTSVGKSMFAVNLLTNMAQNGIQSLYFDLENDMQMTLERITFSLQKGQMSLDKYRKVTNQKPPVLEDMENLFKPVREHSDKFNIWDLNKLMDRYGDVTWPGVKQCLEEAMENPNKDIRIVFIDHLHYFSPAETDHAYLGEVARQLNNIAAKYNIAVVLLAHTKKGLTENNKKDNNIKALRPTIDHIAGSAMIAKHFKNILALQRSTLATDILDRTKTELYVDKTKYGPSASTEIYYCEQTLCFRNKRDDVVLEKAHAQMNKEMEMMADSTNLPVSIHENPITLGELKAAAALKVTPEPIVVAVPAEPQSKVFKDDYTEKNKYDGYKHPDLDEIPF